MSVEAFQELTQNGKLQEAGVLSRRLWRRFGVESATLMPRPVLLWPLEIPDTSTTLPPLESRSYDEELSLYHVLPQFPFGAREIRARLQAMDPKELDLFTDVVDGMAMVILAQGKPQALIDRVRRGEGGRVDNALLLRVLESTLPLEAEEQRELLGILARQVDLSDLHQVLRLARVAANHQQSHAIARSLFRWCAAWIPQQDPKPGGVTASEVLEVYTQTYSERALQDADHERLLDLMAPGEFARFDEQRCAALIRGATTLLGAAKTQARYGKWFSSWLEHTPRSQDIATALLGLLLQEDTVDDPKLLTQTFMQFIEEDATAPRPPVEITEWIARTEFVEGSAGGERLFAWIEELPELLQQSVNRMRLSPSSAARFGVFLSARLLRRGEGHAKSMTSASRLLQSLRPWSEASSRDLEWWADALRQLPLEAAVATGWDPHEEANRAEKQLLLERRVSISRLVKTVERWAREEPERALAEGNKWTEYTLYPPFLEALIALAERQNHPELAARWRALLEQAQELLR